MGGFQLAFSLVGIFLVIAAAYYVTYFISAKAQGMTRARGGSHQHIKLISRFAIARDKSFCIVQIAGSVYIIGITNQTMTLIDKIDSAAFAEFAAERGEVSLWPSGTGANPFSEFIKLAKNKTAGAKEKLTPKTKKAKQDIENIENIENINKTEGAENAGYCESIKNIRILASRDDRYNTVFLTNYNPQSTEDLTMSLYFKNAKEGVAKMTVCRIDNDKSVKKWCGDTFELIPTEERTVYVHEDFWFSIYVPADSVVKITFDYDA